MRFPNKFVHLLLRPIGPVCRILCRTQQVLHAAPKLGDLPLITYRCIRATVRLAGRMACQRYATACQRYATGCQKYTTACQLVGGMHTSRLVRLADLWHVKGMLWHVRHVRGVPRHVWHVKGMLLHERHIRDVLWLLSVFQVVEGWHLQEVFECWRRCLRVHYRIIASPSQQPHQGFGVEWSLTNKELVKDDASDHRSTCMWHEFSYHDTHMPQTNVYVLTRPQGCQAKNKSREAAVPILLYCSASLLSNQFAWRISLGSQMARPIWLQTRIMHDS